MPSSAAKQGTYRLLRSAQAVRHRLHLPEVEVALADALLALPVARGGGATAVAALADAGPDGVVVVEDLPAVARDAVFAWFHRRQLRADDGGGRQQQEQVGWVVRHDEWRWVYSRSTHAVPTRCGSH